MVTLFKELIWPYFMYLLIAGTCFYALYKKPEPAILLYAVLLGFPQLWAPIQTMPLGSMALTLLIFSALVGGWVHVPTPQARGPNATLVIVLILFTYFCVIRVTSRYDLPPPLSADNPVFTNWRTFSFMLLLYFVGYRVVRTDKHVITLAIGLAVMLLLLSVREFRNFYVGDGFPTTAEPARLSVCAA